MRRPESIRPFISAKQWASLRLSQLEADEAKEVVDLLVASFKGAKPGKVSKADVNGVLDSARFIAGCFTTKLDGTVTRKDLREAEVLVARQKRKK